MRPLRFFIRHPFKRLSGTTADGRPRGPRWFGDQDHGALIDEDSGQVLATIRHDGYGKFDPVPYVGPIRAVRLLSQRWYAFCRSLRPFPRVAVSLFRLKSMEDAQAEVEAVLLE